LLLITVHTDPEVKVHSFSQRFAVNTSVLKDRNVSGHNFVLFLYKLMF